MKRIITCTLCFLLVASVFAGTKGKKDKKETKETKEQTQTEKPDTTSSKGKDVLNETGQFLKSVGKEIGSSVKESYENLNEVKCYGTWVYKSDHCVNTIIIREDGTMEITKKIGGDTDFWRGTYSVTIRSISFTITESGRKSGIKSKLSEDNPKKWFITYFMQDEEGKVKFISDYIPTDIDATDFSGGVIFTRK